MRRFLPALAVLLLLTGCTPDLGFPTRATPTASPTPTVDPEAWVMTPDSLGPITVATTASRAKATGLFRAAPSPCSRRRLDWHDQTYKPADTGSRRVMSKPYFAAIFLDREGEVMLIEPGPKAQTDLGIRRADSLSRLLQTYGDELIPGPNQTSGGGFFAVNGDRSHLLYNVRYGKVLDFAIVAGRVNGPEDFPGGLVGPVITIKTERISMLISEISCGS